MRVGFIGSCLLGIRCLELLSVRAEVFASVTPRDQPVRWADVVDEDELERVGLENRTPSEVFDEKPDLVVSVLASHIFTPQEIDATPYGIVNLHPAPLPGYRGCNSYAHAILNGEDEYGVSLHYVEPTIDTGPIIDSRSFPIYGNDTSYSLRHRSQMEALTMFVHNLPNLLRPARVHAVPQEGKTRYYTKDSLKEIAATTATEVRALTFTPFLDSKHK